MNILIEWLYRTPKGAETVFRSEEMPAAQALLLAEDLERTGRAKSIAFIDRFDSSWTIKELKGYLKGIETEPHNVTVYFDGGFDRATSTSVWAALFIMSRTEKRTGCAGTPSPLNSHQITRQNMLHST